MNEFLFRLVQDNQNVGYMKYHNVNMKFYSKELYGWSSNAIAFDDKDQFLGIKDRDNRLLFEGDIFKYKPHPDTLYFYCWSTEVNVFPLYKLQNDEVNECQFDFFKVPRNDIKFFAFVRDNDIILDLMEL